MRPVVVAAILLLVVPMSMSAWTPKEMCKTKYKTPCKKYLGDNWFQMGNRCVKAFKDNPLNHHEAEFACRKIKSGEFQGHLVSIHSLVELSQVECAMYKLQTGKAHYWIGLFKNLTIKDSPIVTLWTWTDDTRINYEHWANGQPDNYLWRENCAEMNYWSWGLWNDEQCGSRRPYVCAVRVW